MRLRQRSLDSYTTLIHLFGHRVRTYLFCIFLSIAGLLLHAEVAYAQEAKMSVASFEMDEMDLTANLAGTSVTDKQDGQLCALIKVETTERGFTFDFGMSSIGKVEPQNENHPSEIWVYVSPGAMRITIQHAVLGKIEKYDMKGRLKSGKTYKLKLTSQQVNTLTFDDSKHQVLELTIFPVSAQVSLNGIPQTLDEQGFVSVQLPFGQHHLSIKADNYYPLEKTYPINDPDNKQTLSIRLKQAFGWLTFKDSEVTRGAKLYVDGDSVGTWPMEKLPIHSGPHTVSLRKWLYKDYTEQVTIVDSVTTQLQPRWELDCADVKISVGQDEAVSLYVDGKLFSQGDWSGRLPSGTHLLDARKESHTSTQQTIEVTKGVPSNISMPLPTPIYGALRVETNPLGATVYVDGQELGKTPFFNENILIGAHKVKVALKGHKTETMDVDIKTGEETQLQQRLTNYCYATITSTPAKAQVYLEGRLLGETPYKLSQIAGTYKLRVSHNGYISYEDKKYLDANTKDINVHLKWNYLKRNEFYAQVGYNAMCCSGLTGGVGGYIHDINVEANYLLSFVESETIYWSSISNEDFRPFTATYKPNMALSIKFGYGFRCGGRVRLTPQVGGQYVRLAETSDSYEVVPDATVCSLSVGLRLFVALSHHIGISLTPEYLLQMGQSDGYDAISQQSSSIKAIGEGVNANLSLNFYF